MNWDFVNIQRLIIGTVPQDALEVVIDDGSMWSYQRDRWYEYWDTNCIIRVASMSITAKHIIPKYLWIGE